MNKTDQLLAEILAELRSSNQPLGFGHPPKPRYIYANRQYSDCLWYHWNGAKNEHEPIDYHALTGTIEKLEIESKEFRGKPDPKVNLHIRADRLYVIQAGFDTLFAKGLLFTLSKLPAAAFKSPITIAVEPGETEQVLFCRIYNPATGQAVYAPYPEDVDWAAVAQKAIGKINPSTPTPEPDGQGRLIEEDTRGIIDQLTSQIKTTPPDVMARKVQAMAPTIGQTQADVLLNRIDLSDTIAQISAEMTRVGWSKKQGADFLVDAYGKRTRAELNEEQLQSFLGHLKNLPSVQPAAATGEW
ncbi:MAG: hypothetical protein ACRC62_18190 [Microcoleus sp.]